MLQTNVIKTDSGVTVTFTGDVRKSDIETMVDECGSGRCGCDCAPAVMNKIETMQVNGQNGEVSITLRGRGLEATEVENAVQSCDIEALR